MTQTDRYYRLLAEGQDMRSNLIALKEALKDPATLQQFVYHLGGDFHVFVAALRHTDPKVRRNAALILGMMETEDVLPFLFDAWEKEQTLFVRDSYLKAMEKLDVRAYEKQLRRRMQQLQDTQTTEETGKHVHQELAALQKLLRPYDRQTGHVFTAQTIPEVLLLCRKNVAAYTAKQITLSETVVKGNLVQVKEARPEEIMKIRTWQELLLPVKGGSLPSGSAADIGRSLATRGIEDQLDALHKGEGPWRYRLELRENGRMADPSAVKTIRKICGELDLASQGRLMNSPDDYEVEIRLIHRKDGSYLPLLKCSALADRRFVYRREYVADSLAPVTAACIIAAASEYLTEEARVYDPFCGVGTLLTERCYYGRTGGCYGTDIYKEAIDKARDNSDHAGLPVHYVQRDFFTFKYEHPFDEVITDMPRNLRDEAGVRLDMKAFTTRFLTHLPGLMRKGAVVVLYTLEAPVLRGALKQLPAYHIEKVEVLNEKSGACIFVLRYMG